MSDFDSSTRAKKRRRIDPPTPSTDTTDLESPDTMFAGQRKRITRMTSHGGTPAVSLDGYSDLSAVHTSGDICSLRAWSIDRSCAVFLKFSQSGRSDFVARSKQEARVLNNLEANGVDECTKFLALEQSKYGITLIALDNGITLFPVMPLMVETKRRLAEGETVWDEARLAQLYHLSIQLITLLGRIHEQNVRHGGLRTGVCSVHPSGKIHIGDMHFAYDANEDPPKEAGMREDVLSYLAPEATGRQARSCDHRTDYYGVGAILFELLTGEPPFVDTDPLELIHQILTRHPALASDIVPSVPLPLARVVAKLLSKSPQSRYQSVGGIVADLERLAAGQADLVIGRIDADSRFAISKTLYARDEQAKQLREAFDRVRTSGRGELALIRGPSGVGKSALVDMTLHDVVVACDGYLARAKFNQVLISSPLFAITAALSTLLRRIFSETEATLEMWRERLSRAMGAEARVIAAVLPVVELVFEQGWIERQPAIADLPPEQATARLENLVKSVFRAFAQPGQPLLIVLDDLQWCSSYDTQFIASILAERDALNILTCCIYRDNEVGADHVMSTNLFPHLQGAVDLQIDLKPFTLSHVIDFAGDTLGRTVTFDAQAPAGRTCDDDLRELSQIILSSSAGNPFFAQTILRALYAASLLVYDFSALRWTWSIEAIRQTDLSPNVVDLLVAQIGKLALDTQEVLKVAACLGGDAIDPEYLARALARPVEVVKHALDVAKRAGLIQQGSPSSLVRRPSLTDSRRRSERTAATASAGDTDDIDEVRSSTSDSNAVFRFLHDRIQQAAYSLVPAEDRNRLHYTIGTRLCSGLSETDLEEQAFELAAHLNAGVEDVSLTIDDREALAKINILAGQKALRVAAAKSAVGYLVTARDLLGPSSWTTAYDLASLCYSTLVDAEYASSQYPEALAYAEHSIQHVRTDLERLKLYSKCVRCATGTGDPLAAVKIGFEGLRCAGINIPLEEAPAGAFADALKTKVVLNERQIGELAKLPRLDQPLLEEAQAIIAALVPPVYFGRIYLLRPMIFKSVNLTITHGICQPGIANFVTQGLLLSDEDPRIAQAFGRLSLSLLDQDHPISCSTYKIFASHIQVWNEPLRETFPTFLKCISIGIAQHNAEYTAYGCSELIGYQLFAGEDLRELETSCRTYQTLLNRFGQEISSLYLAIPYQAILNFRGQADDPFVLHGTAFRSESVQLMESRPLQLHLLVHTFFTIKLATFLGDWHLARKHLLAGRRYLAGAPGILYDAFFCLYEAVLLYDDYANTTSSDRARIEKTMNRFESLASNQPDNFRASLLWLKGERARALGDKTAAQNFLEDAIEASTAQRTLQRSAILNERCATLLGKPKLAAGYLIEAERLWRLWGCELRAQAIVEENMHLFAGRSMLVAKRRSSLADDVLSPSLQDGFAVPPAPKSARRSIDMGGSDIGWDPSALVFARASVPARVAPPSPLGPTDVMSSGSDSGVGSSGRPISHVRSGSLSAIPTAMRVVDLRSLDSDTLDTGSINELEKRSALGVELDMKTVLKASLVISEELNADRRAHLISLSTAGRVLREHSVVSKLMSLVLQSAGADVCHLILEKAGILCGEATSLASSASVEHHRFERSIEAQQDQFPVSVINYVARTRSTVMNELDEEMSMPRDPYLEAQRPKSILCLPLQSHSKLVGVLFLSNDNTTQAFTPSRLELLSLISAQAASAIERSRLVGDLEAANASLTTAKKTLEDKVASRTIELRDKNASLQGQIRERETAQLELRRARDAAESATKQKSLFLANMSHEIRTPFNAIVSLSGLLLETPLNPTQADWAQTIRNSSSELIVIINDLLDHSKIENGSLELQQEPLSLRSCVDGSLELLAEKAAAKNLELAFVWHQHDEQIIGDIVRLRQIVVNYLSNAIKFTTQGHVIVRASTSETGDKDVKGRAMIKIRISVEDTGTGISETGLTKLFKLYSQADGADTTSKFGGTGLGLSIALRLCQHMGGTAWAESKIGKGSKFFAEILCPRADVDLTRSSSPADVFKGKRCLILDGHEATRHVVGYVFERLGMIIKAANDWEEAFALALAAFQNEKPFDLIAIDAFLPDFGALSLLRKLRQRAITTPTLVLTRMGSPIPDELRSMSNEFLIKPVKQSALISAVSRILSPQTQNGNNSRRASQSDFPTIAEPSKLKVLVVDDNPVNVKVGVTILKRLGYSNVDTAADGLQALEACERQTFDVILMDVQMPRMNGLDATRELCRRFPANERPFIIGLTANALAGDREKCIDAGMSSYVSKPVLVSDLTSALNKAAAVLAVRESAESRDSTIAPAFPPAFNKAALLEYRRNIAESTAKRRTSSAGSSSVATS